MGWELFSQYVRAIREAEPRYFIYENNKSMSKDIYAAISDAFGFEPVLINSALVSAQNRQRYYWVGKRNEDGSYSNVDVHQPKDRGILLRDVLDGTVDRDKYRGVPYNICAEPARCFTLPRRDGEQTQSKQYRVYGEDGKSVSLCAEGGGMGAKTGLYAISVSDGKKHTIYAVENGVITIKGKTYPIKLKDGLYVIRKLTVSECMRLQTVPEWYQFPVSNSQAYKLLGNGWTCEVIAHILKEILREEADQQKQWHWIGRFAHQLSSVSSNEWVCSKCDTPVETDAYKCYYIYCPYCGAKIIGE